MDKLSGGSTATRKLEQSAKSFQARAATVPVAPKLQSRAEMRPKALQHVKLEQSLEISRREVEAAYARRFGGCQVRRRFGMLAPLLFDLALQLASKPMPVVTMWHSVHQIAMRHSPSDICWA